MPFLDKVGEELQEEGYHEQADVHAIDIGIRSHDDLVISQALQPVFYVQGGLQQVELLVLIDHLLGHAVAVQRFAAQAEDGLCVHVAALGDAAAGRVALGDEDARILLLGTLRVGEVYAAVAQLAVVQVCLLRHLACLLRHACHRLALALALRHLLQDDIGHGRVLVQVVVHLLLHEVANELVYADAALWSSCQRPQFNLCLAFEHRLLNVDADGRYQSVAYVHVFVVLSAVVLDDLGNVLLEGCLMRAPQGGVLSVYEAVVLLAVLAAVGEGYLYVLAAQMHNVV